MEKLTEKEHKQRINTVIDYTFKNITGDVSLETLARIANYSPYHFQKVFKHVIGESPKQYVIKLKLESALHLVIVHPHKSILEIGLDSGFSSATVFSRAFKNYFNITPDKVRSLSAKEKLEVVKKIKFNPLFFKKSRKGQKKENIVTITKTERIKGIYLTAPFHDSKKIQEAFKELLKVAKANDLYTADSKMYGILSPQHGHMYLAFLSVDKSMVVPQKLYTSEIKANKYAVIDAMGNAGETMKSVHFIFRKWLPESGYKIADQIIGYESFSENPASICYESIKRKIHIPIQAA